MDILVVCHDLIKHAEVTLIYGSSPEQHIAINLDVLQHISEKTNGVINNISFIDILEYQTPTEKLNKNDFQFDKWSQLGEKKFDYFIQLFCPWSLTGIIERIVNSESNIPINIANLKDGGSILNLVEAHPRDRTIPTLDKIVYNEVYPIIIKTNELVKKKGVFFVESFTLNNAELDVYKTNDENVDNLIVRKYIDINKLIPDTHNGGKRKRRYKKNTRKKSKSKSKSKFKSKRNIYF